VALQYGVPLRDLVNKFAHVRFEPSGFTGSAEIPIAKSIVDYIFRWLGSRFLPDDEKAQLGLIDRSAIVDGPSAPTSPLPPVASAGFAGANGLPSAAAPSGPSSSAPTEASGEEPKAAVETAPAAAPAADDGLKVIANGHSNGNGKPAGAGASAITLNIGGTKVAFATQADAPSCAECGSIMVRNGSCYKCLNCGSTSGCS
jgi:ribonucleoside-diphosphate reductase alpha chain